MVTMHIKDDFVDDFIQITSKHCDDSLNSHYSKYLEDQTLPCPSTLR